VQGACWGFPSGTAEGERSILEQVFVYVDEFADVMAPPTGNPYLLVGAKGSGKSAIIDFGLRVLEQQGVPAVLLTPTDFDTSGLGENNSTGDMVRIFSNVMMTAIAQKLAEQSTGWFDGDRAVLYREAVDAGVRSPDFIGRMGKFLSTAAKPLIKVDFDAAFPHLTKVTKDELEKSISRVLDKKSFYIFIDDTDQIANPDKVGHLNRIWALLLAVRKLCSDIQEVKAVISIRTEVWERLKVDTAGQRDQTDHFNSLRVVLKSDRKHVANIVERRLSLAAAALGSSSGFYQPFFDGIDARAPFSEDRRSWRDLIVVRSRERPRDAIQLVNQLARRAAADKKDIIDEDTFHSVMPVYSERIAKDFAKEVSLECSVALEVLRTFATVGFEGGAFTFTPEQAFGHFKSVLTRFSVDLYGITLSQTHERDIFELWRFFYLSGVVNARVSDTSEKDGYRHLDPEQDPSLVSKARWNDVQKILWEINTVFRDYLITVGTQESLSNGLAVKIPSRNRGGRSQRRRKR